MPELNLEGVSKAVNAILKSLGEPTNDTQAQAMKAFQDGDYQRVKRLASTNLGDYYIKSLGYLGSAFKLTPNTDTILAESARSAADFTREKTLTDLGKAIHDALE